MVLKEDRPTEVNSNQTGCKPSPYSNNNFSSSSRPILLLFSSICSSSNRRSIRLTWPSSWQPSILSLSRSHPQVRAQFFKLVRRFWVRHLWPQPQQSLVQPHQYQLALRST